MKIRSGFVSNSSSSSFILYGASMDNETFKEYVLEKIKAAGKISPEEIDGLEEDDNIFEFVEIFEDMEDSGSLSVETGSGYDDTVYIGKDPRNFEEDLTGAQNKKAIQDEFKKIFPSYQGKFGYFDECWRDG